MSYFGTTDFWQTVQDGLVGNDKLMTIRGRNPDTDTGTAPEDVWLPGGTYTGQPRITPETVTVTSSSNSDTLLGTGVRTVKITGLKTSTSTEYETEEINTTGMVGAVSSSSWYCIIACEGVAWGSAGINNGTITVKHTVTTANIFIQMAAGYNNSAVFAFTVPFGLKASMKRLRLAIVRSNGSAGSAEVTIRYRLDGQDGYNTLGVFQLSTAAPTEFTQLGGKFYPALTDFKAIIESVSDNNTVTEVAAEFYCTDE